MQTETMRTPGLTQQERKGIRSLLNRVIRKKVRSVQTSSGMNVRRMDPAYLQETISSDHGTQRTVTWICLPYFSLERYSGLFSATSPSSFPPQTLLQAQFSRATKERDMQQAVRQLVNQAHPDHCFHISQIWILILDNCEFEPCFLVLMCA